MELRELATKVSSGKQKIGKNGATADAEKLESLRAQLPAVKVAGYFNAGSNGPIPQMAHDLLVEQATEELTVGRADLAFYGKGRDESARARETIAQIFNATASEVALMRSTTEGMNAALNGVLWRAGDEIITTQLEHICLFSAIASVSHRHGVTVRTVDIGNGGSDVLAAIADATTPRTRVIAISHVQWSSGAIMPLIEIAAFARERGILTIIDGAQGGGHIEVDFRALGVDVYCQAGQKWLCGPNSSGLMLLREDRLGDFRPSYLRYGTFDTAGYVTPPPGAARYEMGETYGPAVVAFERGLQWLRDDVGLPWLAKRNLALGKRCLEGLKKIKGVTIGTPEGNASGLVCFNIPGMHPQAVSERIRERGHVIRFVDQRPSEPTARISTSWWTTEHELDDLLNAINDLARKARS
jgi:L-cysteine/cystine lyase